MLSLLATLPRPPKFIRDIFNRTDEQISAALSYIDVHRAEVEAEYQEVLQIAEEIRRYWEERNREHFASFFNESAKTGIQVDHMHPLEPATFKRGRLAKPVSQLARKTLIRS